LHTPADPARPAAVVHRRRRPGPRGGGLIGAQSIGGGAPEQDYAFATEALGTLA